MADLIHKRGDTFDLVWVLPDSIADGEMVGWTGACQIRSSRSDLIATLTFSWVDEPTRRVYRVFALETESWPVASAHAPHRLDVQFTRTSDGYVRSTPTTTVEIVDDVTRP